MLHAAAAGGLLAEARRALQTCQCVSVAQRTSAARARLALTVYLAAPVEQQQLHLLHQLVSTFLGEPGSVQQQQEDERAAAGAAAAAASSKAGTSDSEGDGEMYGGLTSGGGSGWGAAAELPIDSYLQPPQVPQPLLPLVLYVTVPALPRGCLLEVQPLCVDVTLPALQSASSSDSDGEEGRGDAGACHRATAAAAQEPGVQSHVVQYGTQLLHVTVLLEEGGLSGTGAGAALGRAGLQHLQLRGLQPGQVLSARLYCRVPQGPAAEVDDGLVSGLGGVGLVVQVVPVLDISCSKAIGQSLAAALELSASAL
jgi:hypothetical protein